jgi:hypothetical protein
MAFWKEGDRVVSRLGSQGQAAGTVVAVTEDEGTKVSGGRKLFRRKVSAGERVKVRWDDGREGEYSPMDLDRKR